MNFKPTYDASFNTFAVSTKITDENLRLANAVQLKVILYLYRHGVVGNVVSTEEIAQAINRDAEEVEDALYFWEERGVVERADGVSINVAEQSKVKSTGTAENPQSVAIEPAQPKIENKASGDISGEKTNTKAHKTVSEIPIVMPSHEQVALRITECADFRLLFAEAQSKLGKTIGYDGQSVLIMLHDSYGLPIEVILMLIEYAKSKGKTGYSYISKLGKSWAEKEIDTLEAAESYIERQSGVDSLWSEFRSLSMVKNANPTTKQRRFFEKWKSDFGFGADMIYCAYEVSIEQTEKMSVEYMDKVLKSWNDKKIRTPEDVEKEHESWEKSKEKKQDKSDKSSSGSKEGSDGESYNISKYVQRSIAPKYKKNN